MTSRFERLSMRDQIILVTTLATLPTFLFPISAAAQTDQNKTRLVLEIKNFQTITIPDTSNIPTVYNISNFLNDDNTVTDDANQETSVTVEATPVPAPIVVTPEVKNSNQIPPKVSPENRVYMHEPEIRDYICPKIGLAKCEIFIAVLKAENGTHECTRDNRGLNRNGSIDVGLAQINWNPKYNPPYTVEQLRDCKFNLDIALKKYASRGFQPWYAYTKGAYKKFLKTTQLTAITVQ